MLSLNNLCEGKTNELTPVYYSKLCPTTGLFDFVVKDALEYIGILEDKKSPPGKIQRKLNYLIEENKKKLESLG